jgi:long-chain fatty acid transport protein
MQRGLSTAGSFASAFAILCTLAAQAHASGFHIDEQDARATGRAGAVTANPKNASAIYYNPAGIAELSGVQLDVGTSLVAPTGSFTAADGSSNVAADNRIFVLPQVYLSVRASDVLALGVGFTTPFGLALDWPATSPGRTIIRDSELQTFFFTPTLALNLSKWTPGLSLGFGVDLVPAGVRLGRDIPFGSDNGSVALSGRAFGLGGRAGILYRPPASRWSIGLTYRSPVQLDFHGTGDFDAPPAYRASLPPDGDVATSITLPQTLQLGIQFEPLPAWELEVDASWRGWSSYDRLDIQLPNGDITSSDKAWKDSYTLRFGSEFTFAKHFSGRLGVIWDQSPVPTTTLDFQLPDADRVDLTAGFGAALSANLRVDVGALYALPAEQSTSMANPLEPPIKGRFKVGGWVLGVSIGLQFGAPDPPAAPEVLPASDSAGVYPLDATAPLLPGTANWAPPPWSGQAWSGQAWSGQAWSGQAWSGQVNGAPPAVFARPPETRCRDAPRTRATQHLARCHH